MLFWPKRKWQYIYVYILKRLLFIIFINQKLQKGLFWIRARVSRKSAQEICLGGQLLSISRPKNEKFGKKQFFLNLSMENLNSILLPLWMNGYWRHLTWIQNCNNSKFRKDCPFWIKVRVKRMWRGYKQWEAELIVGNGIRRGLIFLSFAHHPSNRRGA